MIVWRVEDQTGRGPYYGATNPNVDTVLRAAARHSVQPDPFDDFRVFESVHFVGRYDREDAQASLLQQYRFAFPSKKAAVRWFGAKALRQLRQLGFRLTSIQAHDVLVSDSGRQCMFR